MSTSNTKYRPGDRFILRGDPDPSCCHDGYDHCQQCQDTECTVSSVREDYPMAGDTTVYILPSGCIPLEGNIIDLRLAFTTEDLDQWRKGSIVRPWMRKSGTKLAAQGRTLPPKHPR